MKNKIFFKMFFKMFKNFLYFLSSLFVNNVLSLSYAYFLWIFKFSDVSDVAKSALILGIIIFYILLILFCIMYYIPKKATIGQIIVIYVVPLIFPIGYMILSKKFKCRKYYDDDDCSVKEQFNMDSEFSWEYINLLRNGFLGLISNLIFGCMYTLKAISSISSNYKRPSLILSLFSVVISTIFLYFGIYLHVNWHTQNDFLKFITYPLLCSSSGLCLYSICDSITFTIPKKLFSIYTYIFIDLIILFSGILIIISNPNREVISTSVYVMIISQVYIIRLSNIKIIENCCV